MPTLELLGLAPERDGNLGPVYTSRNAACSNRAAAQESPGRENYQRCTKPQTDLMPAQTFNTFWYGGNLSALEWACFQSFIEHGHRLRVFCFDPIDVPAGTVVENAATFARKSEVFLFEKSPSAFSNLFRYRVVHNLGEFWVDSDVYCLNSDIPDCDYAWANEDNIRINGAIFKFPANDLTLSEIICDADEIQKKLRAWGQLGPRLLTKHLLGRTFSHHFGERKSFYPLHWLEAFLFWLPGGSEIVRAKLDEAVFIHFWTGMFTRCFDIDYRSWPPDGSFLEYIYLKHGLREKLVPASRSIDETFESIGRYLRQDWVPEFSLKELGYDLSSFSLAEHR